MLSYSLGLSVPGDMWLSDFSNFVQNHRINKVGKDLQIIWSYCPPTTTITQSSWTAAELDLCWKLLTQPPSSWSCEHILIQPQWLRVEDATARQVMPGTYSIQYQAPQARGTYNPGLTPVVGIQSTLTSPPVLVCWHSRPQICGTLLGPERAL